MMDNVTAPTGNVFFEAIGLSDNDDAISPTSVINGSGIGAGDPSIIANAEGVLNAEQANALFPFFDGETTTLAGNPVSQDGQTEYLFDGAAPTQLPVFDEDGNALDPVNVFPNSVAILGPADLPIEDFFGFHSSHQLEYINEFSTEDLGASGVKMVTFEQDGDVRFDAVASPDGKRVFILQQLTKADLAIVGPEIELAIADAIATLPDDVRTSIESVLGAVSGAAAAGAVAASVTAAIDQINALFEANESGIFSEAEIAEFKRVFTDQLNNIQTRADASSFFAQAEISTRIEDITRRAERADAFFDSVQNPAVAPDDDGEPFRGVNLPVGDDISQAGLRSGLDTFIAQETRIRDLDNQRLQLAQTGLLNAGRSLDGPNLIAIFQLNYNLTREAEVNAETEELNQQNALLQVYAAIQQLVNDTLRAFNDDPDDDADEKRRLGEGGDTLADLDADEQLLAAFVDGGNLSGGIPPHPIEVLRGISRPTEDVVAGNGNLNAFSQNDWNIFASQLADTVTSINQESQILTNEISNINRERNRNFDLANNALRRLNDTLTTIARG